MKAGKGGDVRMAKKRSVKVGSGGKVTVQVGNGNGNGNGSGNGNGKGNGNGSGNGKITVERIGEIVKRSGFKANPKDCEIAINLLSKLADFMEIEPKTQTSPETAIRKLVEAGILTEEEAQKAMQRANNKNKRAGRIQCEESERKAVNFSRTCVLHTLRLLKSIQ